MINASLQYRKQITKCEMEVLWRKGRSFCTNYVFPGYYGRYICSHFAPYLNEPIATDEQQAAFDTIIEFLDNTDFDIPEDLQKYLDEVLNEAAMCKLSKSYREYFEALRKADEKWTFAIQ